MRLTILLILISFTTFGQMKVSDVSETEIIGKISGMGTTFIELQKKGDVYSLLYRDEKFVQMNEYKSFTFSEDDFEKFYNLLLEGIQEKKKQTKRFEFSDDIVTLEFKKSFGKGVVEMYHHPYKSPDIIGKVQWLDEKRLNKLFGK